jgi:hypothetical protein
LHPGNKSLIGPSPIDEKLATTQPRPAEIKKPADDGQRLGNIIFGTGALLMILGTLYVAFGAQAEGNKKGAMRQAEHEAKINGQLVLAEILVELQKLRVAVEQLSS